MNYVSNLTGLIGGIAGLVALVIQIISLKSNLPRIKLKLMFALDQNGVNLINLCVKNLGGRSTQLVSIGIKYENGNHSSTLGFFGNGSIRGPKTPIIIDERSELNWYFEANSIIEAANRQKIAYTFRGYAITPNRSHLSRKLAIK